LKANRINQRILEYTPLVMKMWDIPENGKIPSDLEWVNDLPYR
jgi:hypothetical protein